MLDQLINVAKRHLGQHASPLGDDLDAVRSWLPPDESVEHYVRGHDDDERLLWAATPRRLLLMERERFDRDMRKVSYTEVRGIERRPGRYGLALALTTTRKTYVMEVETATTAPDAVHSFVEYVRERMSTGTAALPRVEDKTSVTADSTQTQAVDRTERITAAIRELAELREGGVITDDEFQSEKRKLLVAG